ncbi:hypothetical protein H9639_00870 [Arthrobacter sp. Sa2CUA1]|uniref:DUF2946 domain-containing protein n=1 Tax=Arthrobacter gallicola TaxID=2762225 RepID=A0ABR8UNA3_9MICC|nr:hypothetical protein [Arthrobacter gallicola]MBD7993857.1 hypothetical protein [Arthrobacter gallicola]
MRAGIRAAAGHALTIRSTPQLLTTALGLLAVLAGILGMHMLADPHAAAGHAAGHPAAAHSAASPSGTSADSSGTALRHSADPAAAAAPASDGGHSSGACPECGPAGCAAGLCMMFLVLLSITALIGALVSRRHRNPDRPDPPSAVPARLAPPAAPSLVQLCISRT